LNLGRSKNVLLFNICVLSAVSLVCLLTVSSAQQAPQHTTIATPSIGTLIAKNRLEEAENRLWTILTSNPDDARALNQMARVRVLQDRSAEAQALYQRVLNIKQGDLEALRGLGGIARNDGKNLDAIQYFEQVARLAPRDAEANQTLTILYAQSREFEKSLAAADRLPGQARPAELFPFLADDYFSTNHAKRAEKLVSAVLAAASSHPRVLNDFVLVMLRHGYIQDAARLLEAAPPKVMTADFLQTLARVRMAQRRPEEARGLLNRAVKLNPKSYELYLDSAQVAAQQDRWDDMIQFLRTADEARPDQAEVLQKLSLALLRNGRRSAAVATARRLNALDPENADNAYVLAYTLVEADLEEEAQPIAKKLVSLRPKDANGQLLLGIIAYKVGKMEDAKQALAECLALMPDSPDAQYYSALIERHEGNLEGARKHLEALLQKSPSYTMAKAELGTIYLQMGRPEQAKAVLEGAVHDAGDISQYHYHLSLAYARLGMQDSAKSEMEKYTSLRQREDEERKHASPPDTAKTGESHP